jgi:hypothetical protein
MTMSLIADTPYAEPRTSAAARSIAAAPVTMERVSGTEWERLAAGFDDICQEQLVSFAKARWSGVELEPMVFSSAGRVVGGCLVMIRPLPLGLGAIAVAKWGPMLAEAGRNDAMDLYAGMIDGLVEHFARDRRMMLSVMPHAEPEGGNARFEHLMARGFHRGTSFEFFDRYIVNVRLPDEEQRKSFEQKWRYNLKKSEQAGLTFEHAGVERLAEFDRLYQAMTDRKKFHDYSAYGTVSALFDVVDPALKPELFFVRAGDEVVSGAIIFKAGRRAVYLYGATAGAALELKAGYFMHWHIIRWLRDNTAAAWYDLGGTDGFHGLHQFKKGMVGSAGAIRPLPPTANYAAHRLPFLLGEAAFAARDFVHSAQRKIDRLRPDRASPDQRKGRGT